MRKLQQDICHKKPEVLRILEATEIRKIRKMKELLPDFDLISYGGLDVKDYPIWEDFDLDEFIFIHRVIIDDFGYVVEEDLDELPKYTSGSGGGRWKYWQFENEFAGS